MRVSIATKNWLIRIFAETKVELSAYQLSEVRSLAGLVRTLLPMSGLVMIVDDSRTTCKIVQVCLKRAGFECEAFGDGVSALQWLDEAREAGQLPRVVFLDIAMPRLNGYELAAQLRRRFGKHMAIVMLSQRDSWLDGLRARLVGASYYIPKPFRTQEIVAAVRYFAIA